MSRSVRTDYEAFRIYEKHPDADAYRVGAGFTGYAILAVEKRFTDAELAAEYQFSRLDSRVRQARVNNYSGDKVLFDHYERGLEQEWIFGRFATLPHFDE